MKIPIYAPIKNHNFDAAKIEEEVLSDCAPLFHLSGAIKDRLKIYKPSFSVCTDEELEQNSFQKFNDKMEREWVQGAYNAWVTANLTYIPEDLNSTWQNITIINGKPVVLRDIYKCPWVWRPELEGKIPYIREYVSKFPFEYIQCVRLIVMQPPAIGMIHQDNNRNNTYYDEGFAAFNLNVRSGGGILRAQSHNTDEIFDVPADVQIFHFDDSALHGVTKTSSLRIQFRIYGKMLPDTRYIDMLDLNFAKW
jgi:hypothetical protein